MDSGFWYEAGSLLPPVAVGLVFWFVMRALLRSDKNERDAEKAAEKEYRLRHGIDDPDAADGTGTARNSS
ncbi:hypothetical protein [Brachybacterium squillarum]|uniref:hypothetical protein n=1 Tax=Brachybacterium squillarum TaxID=661979 RepID=UPI002223A4F9|nr:hypothetical protein [Brachybacterium squillarum]MCW1804024.1 hypothetical protein [Brachybacterium squillarum]